jgi:hypothetical protein
MKPDASPVSRPALTGDNAVDNLLAHVEPVQRDIL